MSNKELTSESVSKINSTISGKDLINISLNT